VLRRFLPARALVVSAALSAASAACSLVFSTDGLSDGRSPDSGVSPSDGGAPLNDAGNGASADAFTDAASSDAGATDAGSLVANGGFEQAAAAGCGFGWTTNGSISPVAPGRTGSSACKVCGPGYVLGAAVGPHGSYKAGEKFAVSFYLHIDTDPGAAVPSRIFVDFLTKNDGSGGESLYLGGSAALDATWRMYVATATLSVDATDLSFGLVLGDGTGPLSTCIVVDDVSVFKN
jgi:hypothetical protein